MSTRETWQRCLAMWYKHAYLAPMQSPSSPPSHHVITLYWLLIHKAYPLQPSSHSSLQSHNHGRPPPTPSASGSPTTPLQCWCQDPPSPERPINLPGSSGHSPPPPRRFSAASRRPHFRRQRTRPRCNHPSVPDLQPCFSPCCHSHRACRCLLCYVGSFWSDGTVVAVICSEFFPTSCRSAAWVLAKCDGQIGGEDQGFWTGDPEASPWRWAH